MNPPQASPAPVSACPASGFGFLTAGPSRPSVAGILAALCAVAAIFLALAPAAFAAASPDVTTTNDATAVTLTSATVAGTVNPNSSDVTDCHIDYGPSAPAYGLQEDCVSLPGNGPSPVDVHADLSGLLPHTVYHFRVVATNGAGTTNGPDRTFIADPDFPTSGANLHPGVTDSFGPDGQPFGHSFLPGLSLDGSNTPQTDFNQPCGTAVDSHGDVYVATYGSDEVSIFKPDGTYITQFTPAANGAAPCGLAVDSTGVLYVNGRNTDVYRYTPSAYPPTDLTTYGTGTALDTGHGSTAVAVNSDNDQVYVDDLDHVVRYDSAANANTTIKADYGQGLLTSSYGLAVDHGAVFVNDDATHTVYRLFSFGGVDPNYQLDGTNVPNFPGGFGSFIDQGLAVGDRGFLYVADVSGPHKVIDVFDAAGRYVTQLSHSLQDSDPTAIALDASGGPTKGNVYVTSGSGPGGNLFAFGPYNGFKRASQLAIDQTKHRLYVYDRQNGGGQIDAYDISTPGTYTPIAGNFPISGDGLTSDFDIVRGFAVDQTAPPSPTAGNIYAVIDLDSPSADRVRMHIYGWSPSGVPLGAASGWPNFPITLTLPTGQGLDYGGNNNDVPQTAPGGDGVDPAGNIWLSNTAHCGTGIAGELDEYSPTASDRIDWVDVTRQGDIPHGQIGCAGPIEFDSNSNMYVAFRQSQNLGTTAGVWEYPAAGHYTTATRIDPQSATGIAVDRSTGILYAAHGSTQAFPGIDAYDSGSLFERFATNNGDLAGVAIDQSTGTVYASNGNSVLVLPGVPVPTVGAVTNLDQSAATLNGHVDPQANPDFTDCHYEYVADSVFKATAYTDLIGPGPALAGAKPCNGAPPYDEQYVNADLSGLDYGTTYHYRLVATNANGTVRSTDNTFTTDPAVYGVSTNDPSDLTHTSATLNGSFTGNGHDATYHFQWGTDTSYGNSTPDLAAPSNIGTVSVSDGLANLAVYESSSDAYHYRVVVTNDVGTTYGPDKAFFTRPPDPPRISATSASGVSPSAATLSALINPNLGETVYAFQYGTSTSYGSAIPTADSIGNDQADHPVSAALTGLTPATTYHFRVVATNFGGTSLGPDATFTTPDAPSIRSSFSSAIATRRAHLGAQVGANASPTSVRFAYGTSASYGQSTAAVPIGSDFFDREVGADLTGLTPNTTYHFRTVASNEIGTTVGPDQIFTTQAETIQSPPPRHCRKGFLRRHGACVKHHKRRNHHKRSHRNRGGSR